MYDADLVAGKLRRWRNYLHTYTLPEWEQIPDLGLYMDQVLTLLSQYLSFLPAIDGEQVITTSAINNYVRTKLMPPPNKKKYMRMHIAYLIMICSLKQAMSMSEIQKMIPVSFHEQDMKKAYTEFSHQYAEFVKIFIELLEKEAEKMSDGPEETSLNTESFILLNAVIANFSKLITTKLLGLQGQPFSEEAVADKI
ncbi:MAG: DUF1836 domain-containing protein [Clostridia bacterium]|nr:DUF1836 domain-containing protein [Clostridia bacterium]